MKILNEITKGSLEFIPVEDAEHNHNMVVCSEAEGGGPRLYRLGVLEIRQLKLLLSRWLEKHDDELPELTEDDFVHSIKAKTRLNLARGVVTSGSDIVSLQLFVRMNREEFARTMAVSVELMKEWEESSTPAIPKQCMQLIRFAAISPSTFRRLLV